MDKLSIKNEMRQFDIKNRNFYNELTEEERKKFSNYLMIRWGSAVEGIPELQEFYLVATNERLNKHFFDLGQYPDLQWLMATTVSPNMGTQTHHWISTKKKESSAGPHRKKIAELYPHLSNDDIDLMARINSKADVDRYLRDAGE